MAGFPKGGSGSSAIALSSPDGSLDIGGSPGANLTAIADLAKIVRTVNDSAPVNGNVNIATGSVNITSPDNSLIVGGTTSNPTLEGALNVLVRTVNNTAPTAGNVNVTSTQAFSIATGLPTDGLTSIDTYLNPLLAALGNSSTGTGGFCFIPPCNKPYVTSQPIVIPDHVFLFCLGPQWFKKLGTNPNVPSVVMFQTISSFDHSTAQPVIQLNNNGGILYASINAGSTSTGNWAPIGLLVQGAGNLLSTVHCDGGNCSLLEVNAANSNTNVAIDNNWYGVTTSQDTNGGSYYYGTTCASGGGAGNTTFTIAGTNTLGQNIAAIIQPGMIVNDTTNPSGLPSDCYVVSISGDVVTINNPINTGGITGDTLCFLGNCSALKSSSDHNNHGWRNITGTGVVAGADTQIALPHFSSGGGNLTHNMIFRAGQGAYVGGVTLDSAASPPPTGAADAGHIWRLSGGLLINGARIQCGTSNNPSFPCIQDSGGNLGNGTFLFNAEIPSVGSALDAIFAYSNQFYSHPTLKSDNSTNGWMSTGTTPKANANDQYDGIVIDTNSINTWTDAAGKTQPRIATLGTAGNPNTGSNTPFLGTSGTLTWGTTSNAQLYRSDLIASIFQFAPATPAPLNQTVMSFLGLGSTVQFVPHLNGVYRCKIAVNANVATTAGSMTCQMYSSGSIAPPANGAASGGTSATALWQNNVVHQPNGTGNHTYLLFEGEINITTNLHSIWWFDFACLLSSATGAGGPSVTFTPIDCYIEGPLQVIP